jgi:hypothetical protein
MTSELTSLAMSITQETSHISASLANSIIHINRDLSTLPMVIDTHISYCVREAAQVVMAQVSVQIAAQVSAKILTEM